MLGENERRPKGDAFDRIMFNRSTYSKQKADMRKVLSVQKFVRTRVNGASNYCSFGSI